MYIKKSNLQDFLMKIQIDPHLMEVPFITHLWLKLYFTSSLLSLHEVFECVERSANSHSSQTNTTKLYDIFNYI